MNAKRILITGLAIGFPICLCADVLVSGSVYFDSEQTYEEAKRLAEQGDNQAISKLIADRHVSQPMTNDVEVSVIGPGRTPDGLVEFRFQDGPTPYWSLAKWVKAGASSLPVPAPSPAQATDASPAATPSPVGVPRRPHHLVHRGQRRHHRYWHLVNGHWYWSPVPLKSSRESPARSSDNQQ